MGPLIWSFYIILYNQQHKQKMAERNVMKEKPNPLVEEYRRTNNKPK